MLVRIQHNSDSPWRRGRLLASEEGPPALLTDDLASLRKHLEAAGVEVVDDQPLPGFERFYTYDPFGNRLELLTPTD